MSRSRVPLLAVSLLALAGPLAATPAVAAADERPVVLQTRLSGAEEVRPGDPDGRGNAVVKVKGDVVCVHLTATGVDPLTAAHIHEAPAGTAGPVVLPLTAPDPSSRTCATDAALADDLRDSPEDYYVNVHNAMFPAGALRGQLG